MSQSSPSSEFKIYKFYFYYLFNIKVFTCSIDGNEKNNLLLENEISDLEFY